MKCDDLKKFDATSNADLSAGYDHLYAYDADEVEEAIAELKAENKRLKGCEMWMKQHFYCEEVIACESAKNRQLKRALWLARARTAYLEYRLFVKESVDDIDGTEADHCERMAIKWQQVERKCLKKAEEYV